MAITTAGTEVKILIFVVDESNLVKNPQAIRTQRITEISKLCKYKLILNGTPLSEMKLICSRNGISFRLAEYLGYQSLLELCSESILSMTKRYLTRSVGSGSSITFAA